MGSIKVILKKDITSLGEEGDIKSVKKGYARNFLLPRQLAIIYSNESKKHHELKKEYYEKRKLEKRENAGSYKEKLEAEKITIHIIAGEKGRLYGTITTSQIADELKKLNYNIERKQIELKEHIKFQGNYKYRIHLYQDIYANMELSVIADIEKKEEKGHKKRKYGKERSYKKYEGRAKKELDEETKVESIEDKNENVNVKENEQENENIEDKKIKHEKKEHVEKEHKTHKKEETEEKKPSKKKEKSDSSSKSSKKEETEEK